MYPVIKRIFPFYETYRSTSYRIAKCQTKQSSLRANSNWWLLSPLRLRRCLAVFWLSVQLCTVLCCICSHLPFWLRTGHEVFLSLAYQIINRAVGWAICSFCNELTSHSMINIQVQYQNSRWNTCTVLRRYKCMTCSVDCWQITQLD